MKNIDLYRAREIERHNFVSRALYNIGIIFLFYLLVVNRFYFHNAFLYYISTLISYIYFFSSSIFGIFTSIALFFVLIFEKYFKIEIKFGSILYSSIVLTLFAFIKPENFQKFEILCVIGVSVCALYSIMCHLQHRKNMVN